MSDFNGARSAANESSSQSRSKGYGNGPSSGNYDDYDGRSQQQQHQPYKQYGGGGPVRRGGLIERGRGRDRGGRRNY